MIKHGDQAIVIVITRIEAKPVHIQLDNKLHNITKKVCIAHPLRCAIAGCAVHTY